MVVEPAVVLMLESVLEVVDGTSPEKDDADVVELEYRRLEVVDCVRWLVRSGKLVEVITDGEPVEEVGIVEVSEVEDPDDGVAMVPPWH